MSAYDVADVVTLVELLKADRDVAWEEVESLVADFPGWRHVVSSLHSPAVNPIWRTVAYDEASEYAFVSSKKRQQLLDFFQPYAIFLDARRTPAQKAAQLTQLNPDGDRVRWFCREHLQDGLPEVAEAARAVLEACEADATLLRGASVPEEAREKLLRAAQPGVPASDALLQPAAAPDAEDTAPPSGWIRRLFSRKKQT
jgi:hypothetical protein